MASQWSSDDEQLIAALSDALGTTRNMPATFADAGKAAFTWHSIDADLATLTRDSAVAGDHEMISARSQPASLRSLTFTSAELTIELELSPGTLLGQIVPPQTGQITARAASGTVVTAPINAVGYFTIRPIPEGSFRLHCHTAEGVSVCTSWVTL
jgi:hypothetical protein